MGLPTSMFKPLAANPTPRNLESRESFTARYTGDPGVKATYSSAFKRNELASVAWAYAKARSLVSVTNSEGEWLITH